MEETYNIYPTIAATYKHYKGGTYVVIMLAKNTTNGETMVVYSSLEHGTNYVRPLAEFMETGDKFGKFSEHYKYRARFTKKLS